MSTIQQKDNLYKLALLEDIIHNDVIEIFEQELSRARLTLQEFSNLHQHAIYHMCYEQKCCQCTEDNQTQWKKTLHDSHLLQLFGTSSPCNLQGKHEFCCWKSKMQLSVKGIDTYLARILLLNFCDNMFWYSCLDLQEISLETFLNSNKHNIFHMWQNDSQCCQCDEGYNYRKEVGQISKDFWTLLFNKHITPCLLHKGLEEKSDIVCCVKATSGIQIKDMNCKLKTILLESFCPLKKTLTYNNDILVEICMYAMNGTISDEKFTSLYGKLFKLIIDIATVFSREPEYRQKIREVFEREFDESTYTKYQTKLRNVAAIIQNLHMDSKKVEVSSCRIEEPSHIYSGNEKVLFCDICRYDDKFVDASIWCSDCLELYCYTCHKIHSRGRIGREHITVSIDEDLKKTESIRRISMFCPDHSRNFILYCSNHNLPICYICLEQHENCTIVYLPNLSNEAEMSAKFEDVTNRTNVFLEHIALLMSKVENETLSISKERDFFVKSVEACATEILRKTDMIKENGLRDLESSCNKILSKKHQLVTVLVSIYRIRQQLPKLKLHDSDGQAFLVFFEMQKDLQHCENQLNKTVTGNQMEIISPSIIFTCDEVLYERNVRSVSLVKEVTPTSVQQIKDLQLQVYCMFEIPKGRLTNKINGSTFLSNDCICFSDNRNKRLLLRRANNSFETFEVPFPPVDVAAISNYKVAVSFQSSIGIVDIKEKNMEEFKFKTSERFACIICKNDNIIVHVCEYGFYIVSLQGEKIRDINISGSLLSYFSCWNNEIYCTFKNESLLCCFNLQSGNLLWTKNVSKINKPPAGITCDQNGVLFIAGSSENNIVAVNTFDRNCKELIKGIQSMKKPSTISFDSENRRLLVCSEVGKTVLYSINNMIEQS